MGSGSIQGFAMYKCRNAEMQTARLQLPVPNINALTGFIGLVSVGYICTNNVTKLLCNIGGKLEGRWVPLMQVGIG